MSLYREKWSLVEAVQCEEEKENLSELQVFVDRSATQMIEFSEAGEIVLCYFDGDRCLARKTIYDGDWLVRHPETGFVNVCHNRFFHERYEELEVDKGLIDYLKKFSRATVSLEALVDLEEAMGKATVEIQKKIKERMILADKARKEGKPLV